MKSMGIVRRVDELGRVVIPRELRRTLNIKDNDPVEIFTGEDGGIILKKYQPGCICCKMNMTVAEIIEELSKYDGKARVLDFDDEDYMISNIFYDPKTDEIYVKFDTAK